VIASIAGAVLEPSMAAAAAVLLATGLVARHAPRPPATLGLVAAVVTVWLSAVATTGADAYDLLYISAVLSVPWVAGRLLRAADAQSMALTVAADELRRPPQRASAPRRGG
jgi:hypothetical protein